MNNFLFINSNDPFNDRSMERNFDLMVDLLKKNNQVELMLVQDGVYASRNGVECPALEKFIEHGGKVHADDFSLALRDMASGSLRNGIVINPASVVVEAMLENYKVIWS